MGKKKGGKDGDDKSGKDEGKSVGKGEGDGQKPGQSKPQQQQQQPKAGKGQEGGGGAKPKQQQQQHQQGGGKRPQQPQQGGGQQGWGAGQGPQQPQQRGGQQAWGAGQGPQQPQQRGGQQGWGAGQGPQQPQQRGGQQAWGAGQGPQQPQQRGGQQGWGAGQGPQQPQQGGGGGAKPKQQQRDQKVSHPKAEREVSSPSSSHSASTLSLSSQTSQMKISSAQISLARGTKGKKEVIETNYVELGIKSMIKTAYQYDIKFDPDKPKRFLRQAFEEFRLQKIPKIFLAFDGKSIVYSPVRLPNDVLSTAEVKVTEAESGATKDFKVTLKETEDPEIELQSLHTYHRDRIFDKPMRAIQCLDVVLRSPCYMRAVQAGRAFYKPPPRVLDLGDGYELWYGLFQATVLGDMPLLNIDVCHKSFPSAKNVIDIIGLMRNVDLRRELDRRCLNDLKTFLKGLIIVYKPPEPGANLKRYKFNDLKDSANRQQFVLESGQRMTVQEYFASKRYSLKYPHMPCLWVGSTTRNIYLPPEFCEVARGQATMKKAGTNQVRNIIRFAAVDTQTRKNTIMSNYMPFNHNADPTIKAFGICVGADFLNVDSRVISPPMLQYGSAEVPPRNGSWRPDNVAFIQPTLLDRWAILITDRNVNDFQSRRFGDMVVEMGRRLKMEINNKYEIFKEMDTRRIDDMLRNMKTQNFKLVFVIISGFGDSYAKVKQGAEIKHGVLTQCMKSDTVNKKLNPSTIGNILLKVNAKLNGLNHQIHERDKTGIMNEDVMFLGADVTHPSPDQRSIPSVVGVAASHDVNGFQYNIRWRLQDPKKEIIQDMEKILKDQLDFYKSRRGKYPTMIMYYRDGVSDGQFEQVRSTELTAMDRACRHINPRPKITCIVVQKRHHTRFFPKPESAAKSRDRYKNVPPGTIVDTKITHPNECQFFLLSHESIQGTAKPTKYCVIRDDANLNIDDLQAISYNLCHLFARCNRTVSYPAPAYNAHLAAYRGRVYIEQPNPINLRNLEREYEVRQVQESIYKGFPMFFV